MEKLEEEEGEEVWRSNLFVMIYIKTEWGEGKKERNHKIQWKWSSRLGDRMRGSRRRRRRRKSLQQWDRLSATGCNWVQQGKRGEGGDGWPVDRATHTSLLGSTCLQWGREVGIHSIILTHHTKKLSSLTE